MNMKSDMTSLKPLTISELEDLSLLWFDCRLSRSDERMLMKVLAESPLSSPLIDETRALMGLESVQKKHMRSKSRTVFRRLRVWTAAAVVVLVAAVGVTMSLHTPSEESNMYVVYIGGERVTDDELARQMAMARYQESMRMLEETQARCQDRLRQSQEIINQIN